ncbi:hypothetical protein GSI_00009 [Ganoderma sinense ZZ0214-1]|uniref:Uncharacterized protein n=1 Tax=Ganoderma sinense ZZ0214-1 TaxID=1077348 RepID=A0A2G8SRA9_9APHY|nr:hypothetical protein GSI_00009 [Ganoderma sinense ZZ0214-1]
MSLDGNSTAPDFRSLEINTVALDIVQNHALYAGDVTVELSLASLSFGILTILSLTSIYFLSQGSLARTNARVLLLSTILLYLSTATYMAALIWNQSSSDRLVTRATNGLFSPSYDGRGDVAVFQDVVSRQSWMLTVVTIINFIIGDAIVWWRACVIWQHKAVYCIGPLLIIVTLVLAVVSVCVSSRGLAQESPVPVLLISGNTYASAALSLSLATNVLATSLIAYMAWKHRRLVKKHFAAAGTRSQVLQALALLVESGTVYCAIMIYSAVDVTNAVPSQANGGVAFYKAAAYITRGCIIPFTAIYPTVIIVLVALRRAPIDTGGLSRVAQAHPSGTVQFEGSIVPLSRHTALYAHAGGQPRGPGGH